MVDVFQEIWRVLRDDGTAWLNLGDSYAGGSSAGGGTMAGFNDRYFGRETNGGKQAECDLSKPSRPRVLTLKPKDLTGIPWTVAFALRDAGWYLRSDIIWNKTNPMPESVRDRPTRSHEYIFLLTKNKRYYYDQEAIREPLQTAPHTPGNKQQRRIGARAATDPARDPNRVWGSSSGRNKRSVWTLPTQPFKGSHFATFPVALITPMILAGTSAKGCCHTCGAPWKRVRHTVAELEKGRKVLGLGPKTVRGGNESTTLHHDHYTKTTGWIPTCECEANEPIPCRVLDPFCGSGTVGEVCRKLDRQFIGLDLSFTYLQELALARAGGKTSEKLMRELPLFGGVL